MDTKTESGRETAVYGCIDERGKEVIPCIYELVFVEPGGIVALSKEGGVQTFCLSRRWGRGILPPVRYSADKRFLLRSVVRFVTSIITMVISIPRGTLWCPAGMNV